MGIYEELQARGLIAQVTDEERIRDLVNNGKSGILHRIRSYGRQPSCGTFHGAVPDEASSGGGKQTDRSDRRRHGLHRRSFRKNRHEEHDDAGADPA